MTHLTRSIARPFCLYSDRKMRCQSTGSVNFDICVGMMVHGWVGSV